MNRVIKIAGNFGNEEKFIRTDEYADFGIYQEKCPSGYFVSQSWLVTDAKIKIVIPSYNNFCIEEIYDMIDAYYETRKFGIKAINKGDGLFIMHSSGTKI